MSPHRRLLVPRVLFAIALATSVARADWGPDGVTVRPTPSRIPLIAACSDGVSGTFVAWQELTAPPSGVLRIQHLLATGDIHPAWPADGVSLSEGLAERPFIELVPDRAGGAYVCWVEGTVVLSMLVTRIEDDGQIADGWPAAGKVLGGTTNPLQTRPRIIEDGSGGVVVTWAAGPLVFVQRLGRDGLGTAGWPDGPRTVANIIPVEAVRLWPDVALGPDGVFVSWATFSSDTTAYPSGMYLRRLTAAGTNYAGWPIAGRYLSPLRPEEGVDGQLYVGEAPLLDIASDGRGGLFWLSGVRYAGGGGFDVRLHRIQPDGSPSPRWSSDGREVPTYFRYYQVDPDAGLRVHGDGHDGALVEAFTFQTHGPARTALFRCPDNGSCSGTLGVDSRGHEIVLKGDGGAFIAAFSPRGPYQPYEPPAYLLVTQTNPWPGWTTWWEFPPLNPREWYGDIGLAQAGTGKGGVVFFWSQVAERFGLFARRFALVGQVVAVVDAPMVARPAGLNSLRFVKNTGVVAQITSFEFPVRLDLFDVHGRRVSTSVVEPRQAPDIRDPPQPKVIELTFPGTGSLSSAVYFARVSWRNSFATSKVAVVR